jgi:CDP-paratose 2-epimerase
VGSESVELFLPTFDKIVGIDNNMRQRFFGPDASTQWNTRRLIDTVHNFEHQAADIRDTDALTKDILVIRHGHKTNEALPQTVEHVVR